jgi:hypothetical protein
LAREAFELLRETEARVVELEFDIVEAKTEGSIL